MITLIVIHIIRDYDTYYVWQNEFKIDTNIVYRVDLLWSFKSNQLNDHIKLYTVLGEKSSSNNFIAIPQHGRWKCE